MSDKTWPPWVCPIDGEDLSTDDGSLLCPCGHQFPYVDGIPRFVYSAMYADPWGLQWKRYRLTQLDSYTGVPISANRARRCLGEQLWNDLAGKLVLECGSGAGRFTEVLVERGAQVLSVDLSEAVQANQETCPQGANHRIAAADVNMLPFAGRQFDVVFALGMIQHTPYPELTIARLYEQVKPGGYLVLDHYRRTLSGSTKSAPMFRAVLRRLPSEKGVAATERLVEVFLPLHKAARGRRVPQALVSRVSPVLAYYHAYPELPDDLQREWAMLDTHDSLTDWYKHFRSPKQIRTVLEHLGAVNIWCAPGGNGVEARGRRPPC